MHGGEGLIEESLVEVMHPLHHRGVKGSGERQLLEVSLL
jgi:hypothetical protein